MVIALQGEASQAAQGRGKPSPSCRRPLPPDSAHAGCSPIPSHGCAPLSISPSMSSNTRYIEAIGSWDCPGLALSLGGVCHDDPTRSACPLPTQCFPQCSFLTSQLPPPKYRWGVEAGFICLMRAVLPQTWESSQLPHCTQAVDSIPTLCHT